MGKGARSGRPRRACGAGRGGASGSKRPRPVEEEEEEEEVEEGKDAEPVEGEDYCFVCKDGGDLRVCDFRSCHKAYHPACVGKDSDFLNSDEEFICEWHTCFICKGRSRYYCYCCPLHSFCSGCVSQAEFVPVLRKTKGFCSNCLRMVLMIEKNVDVDSDGERADFSDKTTYEFLFKEYWDIVKEKEGVNLNNLEEAYTFLKNGQNCKQDPDLEKVIDEDHHSDDDFVGNGDDETNSPSKFNGTTKKTKSFLKEAKSMKNDFVGWGSKVLLEFLSSIGKDTSKSLDQFGAAEVVKQYIRQKDLVLKDKKRYFMCDEKLRPLFRKSKLRFNRIHSLLERHIAANMLSEDESFASSEDNSDSVRIKKTRGMSYGSNATKCSSEINKRCLASLVRHNIMLIYLKRSLVVALLKEPDAFESKVIGCFVRVKNDPRAYSYNRHAKPYQLGQVTGVKKSSEEYKIKDTSTDVLLCISNMPDTKISMLSDEEFEEEECQDLRLSAQNGSFKRHTVGDLEEKAKSMRRDIMSHWINKELQRLERLIEKANEKGWHSMKHECLDKKLILSKPSEQQRLLKEVPQVIPETEDNKDTEVKVMAQDKSTQKSNVALQGTNGERSVSLKRCSEEIYKDTNVRGASKNCSEAKFRGTNGEKDLSLKSSSQDKSEATNDYTVGTVVMHVQNKRTEGVKAGTDCGIPEINVQEQSTEATKSNSTSDARQTFVQKQDAKATDSGMKNEVIPIDDDDEDGPPPERGGQAAVIDLGDDDAGDAHPVQHERRSAPRRGLTPKNGGASRHRCIWYYIDPQGDEQGPFTMNHLSNWWNNGFFPNDFKVWRSGQTSDDAILLRDALDLD